MLFLLKNKKNRVNIFLEVQAYGPIEMKMNTPPSRYVCMYAVYWNHVWIEKDHHQMRINQQQHHHQFHSICYVSIYLFLSPSYTHIIIININNIIFYFFFMCYCFVSVHSLTVYVFSSLFFNALQLSGSSGREYHFKHRVLQHARTRRSIPHTRVLKREPLVTYWITLIYINVQLTIVETYR